MSAVAAAPIPRETPARAPRPVAVLDEILLELVDIGDNVRDDAGGLEELAASIVELGVQQPVKVTRQSDGRYHLVFGQRRVLASRQAGLTRIPAIVEPPSDLDQVGARRSIEQLAENLQRKDLNAIEEAVALREVLDADPALTQAELARRLGMSAPWVSNTLALIEAPAEIQELVRQGTLSAAHVKVLRGLTPKTQADLAKDAVERGVSAHGLENIVQNHKRNEEWTAEQRRREAANRKAAKERLEAAIAKLVAKAALDAPIRIVGYGDKDGLVSTIKAAGFTDVVVVSYFDSGVAKRAETKCDCTAWRVEDDYQGLKVAEGCIVKAHQEAVYATSRAGDEAKAQLVKDAQASIQEQLRLTVHHLPRHARQALLWHAMDYSALDWLKTQRTATKERKLDPWTALSRLSDEELNALLAEKAAGHFHDRYGLHLDWTAVASDLGIGDAPEPPARAAKGKAPAFTPAQVAAARAELDLDGAD